jgi:hypothetical protein
MCSSVVLTCITVVECSTDVLVLVLLYYSVVQRCTEARSTSRCIHVVDVLSSSTSVVDVLSSTRTYYMYYNCSTWRAPCTIPTSDCYLSHVSQPAMHHPYFFVPTLSGHSRKRPYFVQNPLHMGPENDPGALDSELQEDSARDACRCQGSAKCVENCANNALATTHVPGPAMLVLVANQGCKLASKTLFVTLC